MRALSHCGNWMAALELFTAVHKDPQVVQQAQALKSGLIALSSALQKAAASSGMLNVVHFMMVHHIKVRTLLYFHFFNTFFSVLTRILPWGVPGPPLLRNRGPVRTLGGQSYKKHAVQRT